MWLNLPSMKLRRDSRSHPGAGTRVGVPTKYWEAVAAGTIGEAEAVIAVVGVEAVAVVEELGPYGLTRGGGLDRCGPLG